MAEGDRGVDRRTVLQGVGAGVLVNELGVSVSAATDPGSESGPNNGAPDDPVDGDGVPSEVVVKVNGENYSIPVQRVVVRGTCEDLDRFIANGGMDDPEGLLYDLTDGDAPGGGTDTGESQGDPGGGEGGDGGGGGGSPPPTRSHCPAKQEYQREEERKTGGDDASNAISSTLPNWTVYGHAEDAGTRIYDPEFGGERYLHRREAPWSEARDGETTYSETRKIEERATVTRERLDGGKKRLTLDSLDVSVEAEPEIRIPDWHPTHNVSEECRQEWCEYIQKVLEHELYHVCDVLATSQRVTEHLQDPTKWLGFDRRDSVMRPPRDGQKLSRKVSDERLFWRELQVWVGDYMKWAECLQWKRAKEMHNSREWGIPPMDCSKCQSCEEADVPPLTDFEKWNLQVLYSYEAEIEYEGDSPDDGGYHRVEQWYKGEFEFEPAGAVVPTGGSPIADVIGAILGFIAALLQFIGSLLPLPGGGDGGSDSRDPVSESDVFIGSGTAIGGHDETKYLVEGDTWTLTETEANVQVDLSQTNKNANLEFRPGKDAYRIEWPGFLGEGASHSTSSRGRSNSQEATVGFSSGILAMIQSEDDEGGEETTSGGSGPDVDVPTGGSGGSPIAIPGDPPLHSVDDCGATLSGRIQQDLYVRTQPLPDRKFLTADGEGTPVGSETLIWALVPAERDDGSGPGHIGCPPGD